MAMELPEAVESSLAIYSQNPAQPALEDLLECCLASETNAAVLVDTFRDDLKKSNGNPLVRQRLVQVLLEADHLLEALRHIEICLELWPQDTRSFWLAGMIATRAGDRHRAVKYILELRKINRNLAKRMMLEAAAGQRFQMLANWHELGMALVDMADTERNSIEIAVQIAVRESDSILACAAGRKFGRIRRVSLSGQQGAALRRLIRIRLLQILLAGGTK